MEISLWRVHIKECSIGSVYLNNILGLNHIGALVSALKFKDLVAAVAGGIDHAGGLDGSKIWFKEKASLVRF